MLNTTNYVSECFIAQLIEEVCSFDRGTLIPISEIGVEVIKDAIL